MGLAVERKNNDGAGFTPLHWATGYTAIVEDHEGADNEIMNEAVSNFTPLLIACAYDQLEVVKLLLNKNANIHAVSSEGKSVLHVAAYYKYLELYRRTRT